MSLKPFVSPIALATAAALAFGGSAFAQTMVGDQTINDEDVATVQAYCEALFNDDAQENSDATTPPPGEGADEPETERLIAQNTSEVDLNLITLEDCRSAGLIE